MNLNKLNFINELERLKLPKDKYAIGGSAPLVIRNLKDKNSDLDILVSKNI